MGSWCFERLGFSPLPRPIVEDCIYTDVFFSIDVGFSPYATTSAPLLLLILLLLLLRLPILLLLRTEIEYPSPGRAKAREPPS